MAENPYAVRCGAKTRQGTGPPCKRWAVRGGRRCNRHGGNIKRVRAKAEIRAELINWGLTDMHEDPGEVLLRLVTQSARRVAEYSHALGELVQRHGGSIEDALIADASVYNPQTKSTEKVGEYIRGLATLEAQERDRCANFAAKAVAAGLAKRQVELAERQGAMIADILRTALSDPALGLTLEQRRAIPDVARRALALVAG